MFNTFKLAGNEDVTQNNQLRQHIFVHIKSEDCMNKIQGINN